MIEDLNELHSRPGKRVLADEQEASTKGRGTFSDQYSLERLQAAGEERLTETVAMGLAPFWYRQSINKREMLCDRRHIGVMHSIDGIRLIFDRLLA